MFEVYSFIDYQVNLFLSFLILNVVCLLYIKRILPLFTLHEKGQNTYKTSLAKKRTTLDRGGSLCVVKGPNCTGPL